MKTKKTKLSDNFQINESISLNSQVSELLYKTLVSKSQEINNQNNRFLENLQKWLKSLLENYKYKLIETWNWWDPELNKIEFNQWVINSISEIIDTIRWKTLKSHDWIRKKIDIDWYASNFLIKRYFLPAINTKIWKNIQNDLKIELLEKKDFTDAKVIIDNITYTLSNHTFIVYCFLDALWIIPLEEKNQVKNFVDFINIVGYIPYEEAEQLYLDSYKNLLWIAWFMSIISIFNYFKNNKNWLKSFDHKQMKCETIDSYWRSTTYWELSEKRKKLIEISIKKYYMAQKNWLIVNWNKTKYLIDIWINVPNWPELVAYKKIWLFKIFPSWDVYINNPYWLEQYYYQLGNIVKWKLFFLKANDPEYKTKVILLLNKLNFDDNAKNLIIQYIIKTCKKDMKKIIIDGDEIRKTIEQLGVQNSRIIQRLWEINNDTYFEDLDETVVCEWVVCWIFKYWVIINIGWVKGLLHKNNTSVEKIKNHFKVWDILQVWISKVIFQGWEKKISFY